MQTKQPLSLSNPLSNHTSGNGKYNIGVSSCLLGHAVRYDGRDKYHQLIATGLGHTFNLIPFCPEVAIGMSVPRPPIYLIDSGGILHAVDKAHAAPDYTQQLQQQGNKYMKDHPLIHGYIFQEKSPSCGLRSVKVHNKKSAIIHTQGTGIFTATIIAALPGLPVIEASALDDIKKLADFSRQVRCYAKTHTNTKSCLHETNTLNQKIVATPQ